MAVYQNVNIACGRDDDQALDLVSQVESLTVTDEELKQPAPRKWQRMVEKTSGCGYSEGV